MVQLLREEAALKPGQKVILVAENFQLVSRIFYVENIWRPAREIHPNIGGRQGWLDSLYLINEYEGRLFFRDGKPYRPQSVELIFTEDNKWMSDFLKADATGEFPKSYSKKRERLRMIELFIRLREDWNLNNPRKQVN